MPAYDFICDACGHKNEVYVRADWRDSLALECPNGHGKLRRAISLPMATVWAGKFHDRWYQKEDRDGLGATW